MYSKREEKQFNLVITAVLLTYGVYLAIAVNYSFVSPQLIQSLIK